MSLEMKRIAVQLLFPLQNLEFEINENPPFVPQIGETLLIQWYENESNPSKIFDLATIFEFHDYNPNELVSIISIFEIYI